MISNFSFHLKVLVVLIEKYKLCIRGTQVLLFSYCYLDLNLIFFKYKIVGFHKEINLVHSGLVLLTRRRDEKERGGR